jgi:signal transduction histidine kinase
VRALQSLGLSLNFFAGFALTLIVIFAVVYGGVAILIFWRRSDHQMALFVSLALLLFGLLTFSGVANALAEAHPSWWLPVACLTYLGSAAFILFLFLFPDGHFRPQWIWWVALLWNAQQVPGTYFPHARLTTSAGFTVGSVAIWGAALVCVIYSQVYRYRRVSNSVQRQQTRWVVFGITTASVGLIAGVVSLDILDPFPASPGGMLFALVADAFVYAVLLLVPASIGIAMLRSHLFDVDLVINRTLVYGTLTVCVAGVYILVVGSLSALLQARGTLAVSLLAAGLIAVIFQPLRERLQRGVNRLMYGQRDEPYRVISRLSQRLDATLAPDAVLPAITETVAQALKLPYAAIVLREPERLDIAASYGTPADGILELPLVYQAETIGALLLGPRAPGEAWAASDRELLDELARHAGAAAHSVRLTADLQRSNADLLVAHERLVMAREEERRRLRRDLHDGLGPALAALTLKVGAVRRLLPRDPTAADAVLEELSGDIQATVVDIRRLVYNLRPPTLDELGLVGAICERAAQYSTGAGAESGGLLVVVDAPDRLPPLSAAVEVAAYRITQEALTNVARHAQARTCHISLKLDDTLQLEITDDGIGLPPDRQAGVGLAAMRERAAELGGVCMVEAVPAGGTRVLAQLPLQKENHHHVD